MKKFNKKKGFTIVELVIVVAVIGVLTAVLVPTFVNLTNKASQAADESLVKNLNTQLRMKEQTEGKNVNLTEALEDAKEAGYLVENLTPKGGKDILWNQEKDEFVFGDKAEGELYKYWKIYEKAADVPTTQTYSIYAKGTKWSGDLVYTVGFDAGENMGISSVKYVKGATPKLDVRMRTNAGALQIDADTDVVSHWSFIDSVDIKAIKGDSYHEYGTVRVGLQVAEGHVVVEPKGSVNELTIPETATNVSVQIEEKAEVKTAIIDSTEATVNVAANATVEQVVGETEKITGAGAAEAKENAVTKTFVYQTAEEGKMTLEQALDAGKPYIAFAEDITVGKWKGSNVGADLSYDVTIDGNGHTFKTSAGRGMWIDEKSNLSVTLKNLTILGKTATCLERAIQLFDAKDCEVIIDNVKATSTMYTVNCGSGVEGGHIRITNSELNGWAALNLWGADYDVIVSNTVLNGLNDKTYNADGWNDFSVINLEGDTTDRTEDGSSFIRVDVAASTLKTTCTTGNHNWLVGFNSHSVGNIVKLTECVYEGTEGYFAYDNGSNNQLFVDGQLA